MMSAQIDRLLASLQDADCAPRQAGPGVWIALCPTCQMAGRRSVIEIREATDGRPVVCCVDAHEPPRKAAA